MKKLFIVSQIGNNKVFTIEGNDYVHIAKSLRYKEGDFLSISFTDYLCECKISTINKKDLEVEILFKKEHIKPIKTLKAIIPVLKEKRFKILIEKLTELGTDSIYIFNAENGVVKINNKVDKSEKLYTWIKEAAQQCGRGNLPVIELFSSLEKAVEFSNNGNLIVLDETKDDDNFDISQLSISNINTFIIGPEGSFSIKENLFLNKHDPVRLRISENILRAETAGICIAFLLKFFQ